MAFVASAATARMSDNVISKDSRKNFAINKLKVQNCNNLQGQVQYVKPRARSIRDISS